MNPINIFFSKYLLTWPLGKQNPCLFPLEVAYDSQRDTLYWAVQGNLSELQRLIPRDTSSSTLVEDTSPIGIAVDYIGQRLYWIEAGTTVCVVN